MVVSLRDVACQRHQAAIAPFLPLGCLHEVIEAGPAAEYAATPALFVAGILARLRGPLLWCLHGRDLFAPALSRVGLHSDRVIYCETCSDREVLPAMEEGLRHSALAAVVGEVIRLPLIASRRLQLRPTTTVAIHVPSSCFFQRAINTPAHS